MTRRFKPAHRMQGVNPFRVMNVLEQAQTLERQGRHIVHLEVGEPDFTTAEPIILAGKEALAAGKTQYTQAAGLPELRQSLSNHYAVTYGVEVDPQRIFVTPGASGALVLLTQLLLNPGDGVLMPDPGYPCNRNYVRLAGADAQLLPVDASTDFQPTPELMSEHCRAHTKGVWLASPGNPTGTVLQLGQLQQVSNWVKEHNCHLLVDEIYHGLDYVGGLPTALQADTENFVVNSFSKYFGMTGWRLGWLIVPDYLSAAANILAQNLFIAASTVAQHAALRALQPDVKIILEERRLELQRRRDFLCTALLELGFTIPVQTQGAFYIYAGIENLAQDSEQFCQQLLEQQGVAVTPGSDFGSYRAATHLRFSFTTAMDNLQIAVERLRTFLQ